MQKKYSQRARFLALVERPSRAGTKSLQIANVLTNSRTQPTSALVAHWNGRAWEPRAVPAAHWDDAKWSLFTVPTVEYEGLGSLVAISCWGGCLPRVSPRETMQPPR